MKDRTVLPVLGIGRAYVDINTRVEADFLLTHGLAKSVTTTLSVEQFDRLLSWVPEPWMCTGGCVANTVANLADAGICGGLFCGLGPDPWGQAFAADFERRGIDLYPLGPATKEGGRTGRCLVLITPDGEPTFAINPGVAVDFGHKTLTDWHSHVAYLVMEGNLIRQRAGLHTFLSLLTTITQVQRPRMLLTLHACNDLSHDAAMFCAEALPNFDYIVGNQAELLAFAPIIQDIRSRLSYWHPVILSTLGPHGVSVDDGVSFATFPAASVPGAIDLVGAGDSFLAGLIFRLLDGASIDCAVECGIKWAAKTLTLAGSRPTLSGLSLEMLT